MYMYIMATLTHSTFCLLKVIFSNEKIGKMLTICSFIYRYFFSFYIMSILTGKGILIYCIFCIWKTVG